MSAKQADNDVSIPRSLQIFAFLGWLIPLVVSLVALQVARDANNISQRQASALIRPFAFGGPSAGTDGSEALCEKTLLLSNVGGIGTAVIEVETRVYLGNTLIESDRPLYGWNEELSYGTAVGLGESLVPNTSVDNFPSTMIDLPIGIGPGETAELVITNLLESRSDTLLLHSTDPRFTKGTEDIAMPHSDWVSVQYVVTTPDQSTVSSEVLPCSFFEN